MSEHKVGDKVEVLDPIAGKWDSEEVMDVRDCDEVGKKIIIVTVAGEYDVTYGDYNYFFEGETTGLRHAPKQYRTLKAQDLRPGTKVEYSLSMSTAWHPFEVTKITDDGEILNRYCLDGTRWIENGSFGTVKEANDHYKFRQEVNQ